MGKKICKKCGAVNSGSSMFCISCQSSIKDAPIVQEDTSYIPRSSGYSSGSGYNPEAVSIGTWVAILIVLAIPFINLIALLLMAFSSGNESIRNFAKASLILMLVGIGIAVVFGGCSAFV